MISRSRPSIARALLVSVFAFSLVVCLTSCARIQEPKVVLLGLEYVGVGNAGVNFTLNADVTNPNSFDAVLSRFSYEVIVDGSKLAEGFRLEDVTIPRNATVRVGIPFTITWEGLTGGVKRLLDGKEHDWKLAGSAVLKKGGLYHTFKFVETGRFGGPVGGPLKVQE
jgi:LEA14-like dessication related protein